MATSAFPNDHLTAGTKTQQGPENPPGGMASGAHPMSTFPNSHLKGPAVGVGWAASQASDPVRALREKVASADWEALFTEGKTSMRADAAWSATEERCELLRLLCSISGAKRVLEVGAFCGVATLSMAEGLPADGEVVSLELEAFLMEFGAQQFAASAASGRISHRIGMATETLPALVKEVEAGSMKPFDFVVVDADKGHMAEYFNLIWSSPGLLSDNGTVCIDVTPFKGQPPHRYVKYGQADRWEVPSGLEEIEALRTTLRSSTEFSVHETGGLIVVRRPRPQ